MFTHRPVFDQRGEQAAADRQTSSLLAVAIILVLLIVGLFLVQHLRRSAALEDCLMSGRSNCGMQVNPHP